MSTSQRGRNERQIERFSPNVIDVGQRLREPPPGAVEALAKSIAEIGLRTPITVRAVNDGETLHLVSGATRLAAVKQLGLPEIECFVILGEGPEDEVEAQLWEIDENLARHDLSASEEGEHLQRRKELWERLEALRAGSGADVVPLFADGAKTPNPPEPAAGEAGGKSFSTSLSDGRRAGPQHEKGFAASAAAATGETKRSINLKISRADAIPKDVLNEVRGTHLDTGRYLDALKKLSHDEQREKVKRDLLSAKKPASTRSRASPRSREEIEQERRDKWRKSFLDLWTRGDGEDRSWARAHINAPEMARAGGAP